MKYSDPPVIAVGVAFAYAPLSDVQWKECVHILDDIHQDTFTQRENVVRDSIQILSRSDQGTPTSLKGATRTVRVDFRDENRQTFSVERDCLTYYRFRANQDGYPHSRIVFPEALKIFANFRKAIPDAAITRIAVTYIDDMRFPMFEGESFDLSDYMELGITIPKTASFGHISDFVYQTSHVLPGDDKGSFQIYMMRMATDENECRIRVHWTCQIEVDNPQCENQVLTPKLNTAHQHCLQCFEDSLTLKAKTLFGCKPDSQKE